MKKFQDFGSELKNSIGNFFDYFVKKYSSSYHQAVEKQNQLERDLSKTSERLEELKPQLEQYISESSRLEWENEIATQQINLGIVNSVIYHKTIEEERKYQKGLESQVENYGKQIDGLSRLVGHLKERVYRDNKFEKTLHSLFEMPDFKKVPLLIVHKSGHVLYQSPWSVKKAGDLEGRALKGNFETPGQIPLDVQNKLYRGYVLPLLNSGESDYSVVILSPETMLNKILNGIHHHDAQIQEKIKEIAKQMQEYNLSLDKKISGQNS